MTIQKKYFQNQDRIASSLTPKKFQFLIPEVIYLGRLVTGKGIITDPSKNSVKANYPIPQNEDDLRSFIAFCFYYRRFITNFAEKANCLKNLLKQNQPFIWSEMCQKCYHFVVEKQINPPILQLLINPPILRLSQIYDGSLLYCIPRLSFFNKCLKQHVVRRVVVNPNIVKSIKSFLCGIVQLLNGYCRWSCCWLIAQLLDQCWKKNPKIVVMLLQQYPGRNVIFWCC